PSSPRSAGPSPVSTIPMEFPMVTPSRRDLVITAAVAGLAFGLDKPLEFITPAYAQKTPDPSPAFFKYKVGTVECTALYDGIWEKAHDPAFISNASIDDTKQAMRAGGFTP